MTISEIIGWIGFGVIAVTVLGFKFYHIGFSHGFTDGLEMGKKIGKSDAKSSA